MNCHNLKALRKHTAITVRKFTAVSIQTNTNRATSVWRNARWRLVAVGHCSVVAVATRLGISVRQQSVSRSVEWGAGHCNGTGWRGEASTDTVYKFTIIAEMENWLLAQGDARWSIQAVIFDKTVG
jgi:hypothetical protein